MSEKICRNCTDWIFDPLVNHGRIGACHNPEVLEKACLRSGRYVISIGRFANEGERCESWRAKNGR